MKYKPGQHSFYLNCYDDFGNPHTVGGAILKATVVGAGPLDVGSQPSLGEIQTSRRLDSECEIAYVGAGKYLLQCTLVGAGSHHLVVVHCDKGWGVRLTSVCVSQESEVWPQHCWLDPNNVYRSPSFECCTCYIYLYDRHFNPYCRGAGMSAIVYLGAFMHVVYLSKTSTVNRYEFKFTPQLYCSCKLRVSINDTYIADQARIFTVSKGQAFRKKLADFRRFIRKFYVYEWHPCHTVDRSKILESALEARRHLHYRSFIQFKGESGIDAGGVSRYG